ncbi:uncharacterized protein LOC125770593 isoform X3 [Anopheles funestus]|uniref:uncharacterized protein LOC125770593 isoform X3 n=1 Tax=Anopheles funestus TaxID=62324 RepID=UPI0020C701F7|nr:uncharacterized protein LOC125770593 isoform X3 [Anopheles funestus]
MAPTRKKRSLAQLLLYVAPVVVVSLRSPGEPETTILEEQRTGIVAKLTAASVAVAAAASEKSTTDQSTFAGNLESAIKEKIVPIQKKLSQEEDDAAEEEEIEEEVEEEVEEEEEEEEDEQEEEVSVEEEQKKTVEPQPPVSRQSKEAPVKQLVEESTPSTEDVQKDVRAVEETAVTVSTKETLNPKEPKEETKENPPVEEPELPKVSSLEVAAVATSLSDQESTLESKEHGDKPMVPPQTYLWEEVKKSKEQGGYPWTHLYKGEPEEGTEGAQPPSVESPASNRRRKGEEQSVEEEDLLAEKKVKVQNVEHRNGTTGDHPMDFDEATTSNGHCEEQQGDEAAAGPSEPKPQSPRRSRKRAASHEPETGSRHSVKEEIKHFLDEHPAIRSFSNSLTRQGKKTRTFVSRSLERAKSMADRQIDRARVQMNTLRRKKAASEPRGFPDQKILNLRESPRLNNREIPAYVVRQPSDEVIEVVDEDKIVKVTVETEASKSTVVVPDEIIELPKDQDNRPTESVEEQVMVVEVSAPTKPITPVVEDDRYEIIEPPKSETAASVEQPTQVVEPPIVPVKAKPPQKAPRKKKEHHYEDIEDFEPQSTKDAVPEPAVPSVDQKLQRQEHIKEEGLDPIIGEMLGNDKIKISLQLQDEKFVDDMFGRRKHLDEILQQSSEDEKEKEPVKLANKGLLAPISSIDSTSSDEEARRTHLSTLAEESDTGSIDGGTPCKKQDSLKDSELPPVEECSKELELTPAEEHLLMQAEKTNEDSSTKQDASQPAAEPEPVVSVMESEQAKVDSRWSKMSDHEYEPIGEPVDASKPSTKDGLLAVSSNAQQQPDGQDRKLSNASFLRVPGNDEGDTISMEELQKSIEDRYFNLPTDAAAPEGAEGTTAASVASEPQSEKTSKVKAAMTKAQNSGKQAMAKAQESGKQAMARAQEGGKTLQKKLIQQTDRFKTKMSNIKLKKDKEVAPLASPEIVTTPELEKLDFTLAVPKDEEQSTQEAVADESIVAAEEATAATGEDETTAAKSGTKFGKLKNIHMPKLQKPDFKRPEFTKISKPKMPKLKTPDMSKFKRPEMPKFLTEKPDFSKMKSDFAKIKLARSKSMKEPSPSGATSAASPSDASMMGDSVTSPTKINYTDFSTYPRIFDKFKRQKSTPSGQASVRAGTPPPLEFTKSAKTTRPKGTSLVSRWTSEKSEDTESNRFLQYTGSELDERETSVERRMRQELERAEFEGPELAVTEEQKQLEEYDKENREIHLLSAARHEEFLKRKPPMERQESDLASEEEKQFWASSLGQKIRQNIDMNSNDLDFLDEEERLMVAKEDEAIDQEAREQARYLLELSKQRTEKELERRSSTPYTNQECQSSGSSSVRRRKGVLEEIDDDEFFLRQKGISKDNIQMGEYISSAIKEGLSQPKNALADMDRYDYYDEELDREQDGMRRYYQPSFESDDVSNQQSSFTDEYRGGKGGADFYRTFPPDRPNRKPKKAADQSVPAEDQDYGLEDEEEEDLGFFDRQRTKYGSEQPQLLQSAAARYMDDEDDASAMGGSLPRQAMLAGTVVPPTPPTRHRKKRFRDVTPSDVGPSSFTNGGFAVGKSISNNFISGPPPPTSTMAYRAEVPLAREESFGTIPAPTPRRSRSRSQISKALDDDDRVSRGAESLIGGIIDRSPVPGRDSYSYEISETNGYATVRKEAPPRPPAPIRRRKSTRSLDAPPPRQFNTLPNYHHSVSPVRPQRNYSTINPNRPPRRKSVTSLTGEQQLKSSSLSKDDVAQYEDVIAPAPPLGPKPPLHSGDIANKMKDRPLPPPPRPTRKPRRPDGSDHHDLDGGAERMVFSVHDTSIDEVETATQTDPVSEDFGLDAEIAAVTERAARAHDGEQLEGALNRFREGNAKALSERPKSSRSGSRPETPASILIERKVSTPSLNHESIVEASLTVQPLEEFDDDQYIAELVKKYVSDERKPEPRKTDTFERRFRKSTNSLTREDEIRPAEVSNTLRTPTMRSSRTSVDGRLSATTPEPLRNVEIAPNVIEEIVERLRTTEQQHIDELHKLHQEQLEGLRRQHEDQKRLQEQKLEEQQRQLLEQQNQQLLQTQQLKEQILQQQEHQKMLLAQQQNQQQQLLVAQQQQQLLMEQQEKERELQREKERELLKEREQELERARERERELHLARELELQRAREVEQQRARDLEQQRIREMEIQRARELEHQRLRELEIQRAIEVEQARQREVELQQQKAAVVQAASKELKDLPPSSEGATQQEEAAKLDELLTTAPQINGAPITSSVDVVDGAAALPTPSTVLTDQPPIRPPLPPMTAPFVYHPDYLSYHGVPPSSAAAAASYLMRGAPSDEDLGMTPLAPQRRRRHHRSKRESTSEEDFQREQRRHRHGTRSPEPSIPTLGGQLVRACGSSIRQTGDDLMAMLRASSKDENKRDLHIAIIILIVIVAGLMALGMSGEKAVHHHHWDYFSPPGHGSST